MIKLQPEESARRLEAFLAEQSGADSVRVDGLRPLAGGSSRQVWSLNVALDSNAETRRLELVLRIDPTAGPEPGLAAGGAGFAGEFQLLVALHRQGVPVPRVHWTCADPGLLGGPFYLMDRIEGETIARRILRSKDLVAARERLPGQLGTVLARIHALNLATPELSGRLSGSPASAVEAQLEQIRAGIQLAPAPVPTLELTYRWLEGNRPAEHPSVLVHGDYRMGNVIVGPEGLRAILDWELAHVGDPHEDLAWMCAKTWRFGNVDQPVGGVGPREPFYEAYRKESGLELDSGALRYWEILASAKVSVVWLFQLHSYLSGARPSVEQAAIGRRMAETDLDLLELLEGS